MMTMLGTRLRRNRNACGNGCCDWSKAPRTRKTKHERTRDEAAWRREELRERPVPSWTR